MQKILIGLVVTILLIALWTFTSQVDLFSPTTTTSTTSTSLPVTTTFPVAKSLNREIYLDEKSGEGLIWFTNSTVNDARTAMRIWEERTNHLIKFEEIRGEAAADVVIKFSGSLNESTPGFKTVGEAYTYRDQVRGTIYILPSSLSCRIQGRVMHEIGHIIGLNHSEDYMSVMYPVESCVQNITDEDARAAINIINKII
jgi:hypothetical protein